MAGTTTITKKADSGALAFKIRCGTDAASLSLSTRGPVQREIIWVSIGHASSFISSVRDKKVRCPHQHLNLNEFIGFWLTWNKGVYCFGLSNNKEPLITFKDKQHKPDRMIGYVNFHATSEHEWKYEEAPHPVKSISQKVTGGSLTWKPVIDGLLPENAMIGGMEPSVTYIARAKHNGSLAPGKYVPRQNAAFIAWGGSEHRKTTNIEILCGYNAEWVRTQGADIPENAFIAGYSEVRHEPLYVGRAFVDGNLVTGKVHTLYKMCYLPYKGKEVEVTNYEILVAMDGEKGSVSQEQIESDEEWW